MAVNTVNSPAPTSRRERQREATSTEIRDVARRQLGVTGAAALSLRAVAREMGLSAPALYRYYDDRNALLVALIVDAYTSLCEQVEAARDAQPEVDATARLAAGGLAYRQWGIDRPHEFALVFGGPVPGFSVPDDGPTHDAGGRFGQLFLELFGATGAGRLDGPPADTRDPDLDQALSAASQQCGLAMGAGPMQLFVSCWGRLHGLISLEVFGHVAWVGMPDPGALYRAELVDQLRGLGLQLDLPALDAVRRRTAAATG